MEINFVYASQEVREIIIECDIRSHHLQIFSPNVGCLFVLFIGSFAVQNLLSRPCLFILVFISIILGDGLKKKKILLRFMLESVLPMFSSRSFIVFGLTFKSLIYFELIFVFGVKE